MGHATSILTFTDCCGTHNILDIHRTYFAGFSHASKTRFVAENIVPVLDMGRNGKPDGPVSPTRGGSELRDLLTELGTI